MWDFVRVVVGAAAIFLLPGYALLALARRQLALDAVEAFCLAVGLSLAAIPLALYATTLLGIRQNAQVVMGLLLLCALITLWDWWGWRAVAAIEPTTTAIYGALGLAFLFTLAGRLWSVQGISFPLWTDPYGHTVIAQLIVDSGTIPTSYEPYAPIHEFTYHFGYHTLASWFHWLAALPLPQSLVVSGQLLNALVVPTTYLFVQRLFDSSPTNPAQFKSRVAGLAAAVMVGLLSHMPVQFVNWGRYTQLDGQILLPVALVLYLVVVRTIKPDWRVLLLTALAFAGLFFAHYRIFIFGALLVLILFVMAYLQPKAWGQARGGLLVNSPLIAIVGLLILAPWLWRLAGGFGGNYAREVMDYQEEIHGEYFGFEWKELTDFGIQLSGWVVAALAALWGLWRRERMALALLLWLAAIFVGANLHLIHLTPLYSNLIAILVLYLPLTALCGYLVSEVGAWLINRFDINNQRSTRLASGLMVVVVILGIYGVQRDLRIVSRDNGFVRAGDVEAMEWVKQSTPPDALFYIATFFWTPAVAHGLDGGYYLPLLAARQTIMPLQNYVSDGTAEYSALVNQRLSDLNAAPDSQALAQTMRQYGITHVYVGERATSVSPQSFLDDPADFELLYDKDHVHIFAVRPEMRPEMQAEGAP
jgi:hypothetical protein